MYSCISRENNNNIDVNFSRLSSMILRVNHDLKFVRPCELCDGDGDLRQRKSVGHSQELHRHTLHKVSTYEKRERKMVKLTFLASMAVHVRLQRARSGETFVANLALVFLLSAGRKLRVELTHH